MKSYFSVILMVLLQNGFAQLKCKTIVKNDTSITKCYHKNGRISTQQEKYNERTGKVSGFTNTGEKIFEFYTRTFAGHASVYLDYFENGQVKKVYYSTAPDAGIQWYNITIKYDENGKEIDRQEQSNENLLRPIFVPMTNDSAYKPMPKKTEPIVYFANEYYLINISNHVFYFTKLEDTSTIKQVISIQPNDTVFISKELNKNNFSQIDRTPKISFQKNKKSKKAKVYVGELEMVNNKARKQYFLLF